MHWTRGLRRVGALSAVIAGLAVAPLGGGGAAAETRPRQLEVVDLGTLPGHSQSEALGINDRGTVVGWSFDGTTGLSRAFRWDGGAMTDLGTLVGPSGASAATAVNRHGDIVGYSSASEEDISVIHPVLWQDGELIDLGTLGGTFGQALSINDDGVVTGFSAIATGELHAFEWQDGELTDLGTVAGQSFSQANAVNRRGEVAGESGGPVVWRDGVPTPLPLAGAEFGTALGNNDRGDIVGYLGFPETVTTNRAVVWQDDVPADLGFDDGTSQAFDINNRGQIVGWREFEPFGASAAFVYDDGAVTDLVSLTGSGGLARAINDDGVVAGTSPVPGDPFAGGHAVIWR